MNRRPSYLSVQSLTSGALLLILAIGGTVPVLASNGYPAIDETTH